METNASGTFVNVGNPVIQNGYQFLQTSDGTTPIAEFQVTPISSANFPGSTTLISPLANQIVVLTPLNGTPFTITSVDLALIAGPFTNVVFTGTTASGATVSQTFNITPGPLSTFNFNASFTDLVSLTYTGVGLSPAFRFHVDNIVVTTTGFGEATAADNCDSAPVISSIDNSTQTFDGSCTDYSYQIERIWMSTDACMNISIDTQIITIQDLNDPLITFCPSDTTISCDVAQDTTSLDMALAIDSCDINPIVSFVDVSTQTNDGSCTDYSYVITRTWTATDICLNTSTCVQTITVSDLIAPVPTCPASISQILDPGACGVIVNFDVTSIDNCDVSPIVEQVDATGLSSGDFFEIGVTTLSYRAVDACGNVSVPCEFNIEILDFPFPRTSLICNPGLNVSLNANCQAEINADAVLEGGPYSCYLNYDVNIEGVGSGSTVILTGTGDYTVTITDPSGELSCWGTIHAEDYVAPVLTCTDYTLDCSANTDPVPLPVNPAVAAAYEPIVFEACGNVTLIHTDEVINGTCNDTFQTQILRTWIATDAVGLTSQCVQTITLSRPDLTAITFPESPDDLNNPSLSCSGFYPTDDNGYPDPSFTGRPMLNGHSLQSGDVCGLGIAYNDQEVFICDGTTKILRTWQVIDWCNTSFIPSQIQSILIKDSQGPNMTCPTDQTISTDFDPVSYTHLTLPTICSV